MSAIVNNYADDLSHCQADQRRSACEVGAKVVTRSRDPPYILVHSLERPDALAAHSHCAVLNACERLFSHQETQPRGKGETRAFSRRHEIRFATKWNLRC